MKNKLTGVWHQGHLLCPVCLVQPGGIRRYGSDEKGFWFSAVCPHCRAAIHWHRRLDLSGVLENQAQGEQLSLILAVDPGKKKIADQALVFPVD